jgi:hypothetical protein
MRKIFADCKNMLIILPPSGLMAFHDRCGIENKKFGIGEVCPVRRGEKRVKRIWFEGLF